MSRQTRETSQKKEAKSDYLKAGGFELGLPVNFSHYQDWQYERLANTQRHIQTSVMQSILAFFRVFRGGK